MIHVAPTSPSSITTYREPIVCLDDDALDKKPRPVTPVTLVSSAMGVVDSVQDRPPSELRAVCPAAHGMTTLLPSILGQAEPQVTLPAGWLATAGADQVVPSSVEVVSRTVPFETE